MFKTFSYGWEVLKISYRANGFYAILSIFSRVYERTIYNFIQILLLAKVLDQIQKNKVITLDQILWLGIFYLIASVLKVIVTGYLDSKEVYIAAKRENYIEYQIDKKLTQLDTATFESPKFQELLSQMDGIKDTISNYLIRFIDFIDAFIKLITAVIVVSVGFPIFVPIIIISTIPSFLVFNTYRDKLWPFFTEERSKLLRILKYIRDILSLDSMSKEVTIFKTGDMLLAKIKHNQKHYLTRFNKGVNDQIGYVLLTRLFQFAAFAVTQFINLRSVLSGTLGIGQFTLYFQQTFNLASGAEEILDNYSSLSVRTKYLDKYFEFLQVQPVILSPAQPVVLPESLLPPVIEFKNVSFRYPKTERDILKDFNLTIQSGEKIALVGENGAGKTTLIKLMLRFYDVTTGEILINGINVKQVDLSEWHKQIGALFQDFIKYQFTFKENVFFGDLTKSQDEMLLKEAIKKSGADTFIDTLPKGYDQILGKMFDGGIDLSGGQWQKLALARAFFRDAPLLILDEPTSAIDAKAEYEIFENVQKLQKDKTVIIISHRFSTVRNADRILVLDEGKIIEEGNHEVLMKKKGLYNELFTIQAKGYK